MAGEPSGDRLAASIMRALNGAFGRQQWVGVGGPAMKDEGLDCWIDMDELTVFGVSDAAKNYRRLSRLANGLVEKVAGAKPRLVLTVDAKGFLISVCRAPSSPHDRRQLERARHPHRGPDGLGLGRVAQEAAC